MVLLLRKKKYFRNIALTALAIFAVLVAASPLAIADIPAEKRWLGALLFLGVFGTISGILPVVLLIEYYRSRLAIDGDRLAWQGFWKGGFLHLSYVEQLTWQWFKNFRTIVLQSPDQRLKISLEEYERDAWLPLIRHLRCSIPIDRQRDWDWFCLKTALPLQRAESKAAEAPSDSAIAADNGDFTITRRRWDNFFLVAAVCLAPVVVAWWWFIRAPKIFMIYPALVPLWLYLRVNTPARGIATKRLSKDAPERRFIGWSMALMMPMSALCKVAQRHPVTWAAYLTVFIGWMVITIWYLIRIERRRALHDAEGVKTAALEWELGESLRERESVAS